jgi:serine/threonine protein kinase
MPLTPGTRLGPYQIVATLGAGGMGEVYQARDTRLDREVAVKLVVGDHDRTPDDIFAVQDDIADAEERSLQLAPDLTEARPDGDPRWIPFLRTMGFPA